MGTIAMPPVTICSVAPSSDAMPAIGPWGWGRRGGDPGRGVGGGGDRVSGDSLEGLSGSSGLLHVGATGWGEAGIVLAGVVLSCVACVCGVSRWRPARVADLSGRAGVHADADGRGIGGRACRVGVGDAVC